MAEHALAGEKQDGSEMPESNLARLEKDLADGLRFANLLAASNQGTIQESVVLLHSLLEVLVSKGLVHIHELEKRREKLSESFKQSDDQKPRVHLLDGPDKYAQDNQVIIDCVNQHAVCKGMCCTLWFALSVQDLDEGILKWNYAYPYGIAQNPNGYCVHFDHVGYKCTVYENRPLLCRTYDCRQDKRIWADFDKKTVNPELRSRLKLQE